MTVLRLATFNLLHGRSVSDGLVEPARLQRAVEAIDADVIGLQEVDRLATRSGEVDQTQLVAEALGAESWRFVPSVNGTPGLEATWTAATHDDGSLAEGPTYGVGLVSRLPVLEWRVLRFPAAPFGLPLLVPVEGRPRLVRVPDEPRVAVAAVLRGPSGPMTVVTAHLSFVPVYNARQLRAIVRWIADLPRPAVILGDFNLPGGLPRRLTRWTQLARTPTYPSWKPRVQFDHVLGDGIDARSVRRVATLPMEVSDHVALAVDVDL